MGTAHETFVPRVNVTSRAIEPLIALVQSWTGAQKEKTAEAFSSLAQKARASDSATTSFYSCDILGFPTCGKPMLLYTQKRIHQHLLSQSSHGFPTSGEANMLYSRQWIHQYFLTRSCIH